MGSILLRTKYDPIYSDVRLLYPIILNVINMKVVLLAGGFGSRISEESQFKPKPMIDLCRGRRFKSNSAKWCFTRFVCIYYDGTSNYF